MRKFLMLAAAVAIAAGAVPVLAAGSCEDGQGRSQADPFGGCENAGGAVSCAGATDAPAGAASYYAPSASGAALCVDDDAAVPAPMRAGVANRGGRVSVYADLGGSHPARGAVASTDWVRGDVDTGSGRVCVLRGGAGSAWLSGTGHDGSAEDTGAPLLGPVSGPLGGNPAPGLGDRGFSQCTSGAGVPNPGGVPSVPPTPLPTTVPTLP